MLRIYDPFFVPGPFLLLSRVAAVQSWIDSKKLLHVLWAVLRDVETLGDPKKKKEKKN